MTNVIAVAQQTIDVEEAVAQKINLEVWEFLREAGISGDNTHDACRLFVRRTEGRLFYSTSHSGWLFCDPATNLWISDVRKGQIEAWRIARDVAIDLANAFNDPRNQNDRDGKLLARSMRTPRFRNDICSWAIPELAGDGLLLDSDPNLIYHPIAGVVDLITGKLEKLTPEHLISKSCYSPNDPAFKDEFTLVLNEPKRWLKFLDEIFQGDKEVIEFFQRWLGHCLTGETREEKFLFGSGSGGNGKGVAFDTIQKVMGDYSRVMKSSVLMDSKYEQHSTEIAVLNGARMVVADEIERGKYWAEETLKTMTGGAPYIPARLMRQDAAEIPITWKLNIFGNDVPRLKSFDNAMKRRLLYLDFPRHFSDQERDPQLKATLMQEADEIFWWLVQGAIKWHKDGLQIPQSVINRGNEYHASEDSVAAFVDECLNVHGDKSLSLTMDEIYNKDFAPWKKSRGEEIMSSTKLGKELARIFPKDKVKVGRVGTKKVTTYFGVSRASNY
jgi:putative DNA primase/helicase